MSSKYPHLRWPAQEPGRWLRRLNRKTTETKASKHQSSGSIARITVISGLLVIALTAFVCFSPASLALSLPTGQPIEKTATLIGPKENSPIPLYLRPAANQPNVGYGVNGSSVTVTEQMSGYLPEADQNSAWNHIRLDSPPYTEGWVQGRFLSIPDATSQPE